MSDGVLSIVDEPADNEVSFELIMDSDADNRTGITIESDVGSTLLQCRAERRSGTSSTMPMVSWIRNGVLISSSIGFTSSLQISKFAAADAGVYQCVFMDMDSSSEIVTTIPYRLDTGIKIN